MQTKAVGKNLGKENYERVENIKQGSFAECRRQQSGGLGICKIVSGL
jgi:hypothetical protein